MNNKQHILIVDDDAGTVEIMSIILQNAGYEISTDNNGDLLFLQTGIHPHLILLDNKLGQKKRYWLMSWIKSQGGNKIYTRGHGICFRWFKKFICQCLRRLFFIKAIQHTGFIGQGTYSTVFKKNLLTIIQSHTHQHI